MDSIFNLAKATIENGGFKLQDKLRELTSMMLVGQIDVGDYDTLARLATERADAETDPTDTNLLGALKTLNAKLADIEARLATLEEANGEEPVVYEYPEWERWNGLSDSGYKFGDRVTHLGIKYISNYTGLNVWEPGLLGTEALWSVVE